MKALRSSIKSDWINHGRDWTKPGFRALAIYRFGVWRTSIKSKWIRAPFSLIYRFFYRWARNHYGIEIPYTATVGHDVIFEHQHSIVIHGHSTIGDGTIIRQGVTIGIKNLDDLDGVPVIGKRVNIGAGAVLLGRIHVGDGATIGANAVVIHDVPAGITVAGIPAKPVK
jgi:serine O-acetyltransferase